MNDTPTRFPLAWPAHRPRTKHPKTGKFSYTGDTGKKDITISRAVERLEYEVSRLGGVNTLLSTNLQMRLDGRPRSGQGEPADSGVCLFFTLKGKPISLPCDAYTKVAQNIAALAAHLEATRAIERHGVATGAETLQAFAALPAPDHILPGRDPWRRTLGFADNWPQHEGMTTEQARDALNRRYRAKAIEASEGKLSDLNIARDAALKELK